MKILIVPDSFKGSATSLEVAQSIRKGAGISMRDAQFIIRPLADGGEGSLDVLHVALGGEWIELETVDPLHRAHTASYLRHDGSAYVELARASGLDLLHSDHLDGTKTTTYGTGLLIKHAVDTGCKDIVLLVGGSATNDAGTGIAAALGFKFRNDRGQDFVPTGETLYQIDEIVPPTELPEFQIKVLCDVENPFTGPNGATRVYGPQKGITQDGIEKVEYGMERLRETIMRSYNVDLNSVPGAGAAGGTAGGMVVFFDAALQSGIRYIMERLRLREAIAEADLVITGEGRLDDQTLNGKAIGGVVKICREYEKPVIAICGQVLLTGDAVQAMGLLGAFSIQRRLQSLEEAILSTQDELTECSRQIFNIFQANRI